MKIVERLRNCGQKQQQRGAKLQCQNLKHTVTGEGVGKGCENGHEKEAKKSRKHWRNDHKENREMDWR
jgi:hypothetical protein